MIEPRQYEYIAIERISSSKSGKTHLYHVTNRRFGTTLGHIRWFARWRQYVYEPSSHTVYSAGCMRDIIDFIEERRR